MIAFSALLLLIAVPVVGLSLWTLFQQAARSAVDSRLSSHLERVRGDYFARPLAQAPQTLSPLPLDIPLALRLNSRSAWTEIDPFAILPQVAERLPDGHVRVINAPAIDPLSLDAGASLPVRFSVPAAFTAQPIQVGWQTIEGPKGVQTRYRTAQMIAHMEIDYLDGRGMQPRTAHILVALPRAGFLILAADIRGRFLPLALLLGVASLGLLALALAIVIRLTTVSVRQAVDAVHAFQRAETERVEGQFVSELQRIIDPLNAQFAQNTRLLERTRRYIGKINHDVNHPLAVLRNALRDPDAIDPVLIQRQADRIAGLVARHAQMARTLGPAETQARQEVTDVAALIRDLLEGMALVFRRRPMAFHYRGPEVLLVPLPRFDLEAILTNLVSNGEKFGRSQVEVQAQGEGQLTLCVQDDGPGIPADQQEAVFNWGKRLDEAAAGSGFGLTIVKDVVDLHGGTIDIATGPLGGALITVRLPLPRSHPTSGTRS